MLSFEQVVELVKKESEYAQGWAKGSRKASVVEGVGDADVHSGTSGPVGQPFGISDYFLFAKKYWDEIPLTMSNFTPDGGAVRIRIIKVVSLLIRCLMVWGQPLDLQRIAGHSCTEFPIMDGGLKTFDSTTTAEGCLITNASTRGLRNEAPNCNPLKSKPEPDEAEYGRRLRD